MSEELDFFEWPADLNIPKQWEKTFYNWKNNKK